MGRPLCIEDYAGAPGVLFLTSHLAKALRSQQVSCCLQKGKLRPGEGKGGQSWLGPCGPSPWFSYEDLMRTARSLLTGN